MHGADREQSSMFSYISAKRRAPKDHPLRAIRAMADGGLGHQPKPSSDRFHAH